MSIFGFLYTMFGIGSAGVNAAKDASFDAKSKNEAISKKYITYVDSKGVTRSVFNDRPVTGLTFKQINAQNQLEFVERVISDADPESTTYPITRDGVFGPVRDKETGKVYVKRRIKTSFDNPEYISSPCEIDDLAAKYRREGDYSMAHRVQAVCKNRTRGYSIECYCDPENNYYPVRLTDECIKRRKDAEKHPWAIDGWMCEERDKMAMEKRKKEIDKIIEYNKGVHYKGNLKSIKNLGLMNGQSI